ncbi:alanine racemase [Sporosarcina contaminans]|uniref:Alanine racemase n=1 Tax=Sporosarcina contaminans TaxID=633403 RepID=A0ABW3U2G2_9BACL
MTNSTYYRPTKALIDSRAIQDNVKNLKSYLPKKTEVIAVVKADGYGHGEVEVAKAAIKAGASMVSVATPDEAVRLYEAGIRKDILVMGPSPIEFARKAAETGIIVTVSDAEWLQDAIDMYGAFKYKLRFHIKVDSGMGRIGLRNKETLKSIIDVAEKNPALIVDGIFTHFACADEDNPSATMEQFSFFMEMVQSMEVKPRLVHASNSAATFLYPELSLDAVRFGISLYGIPPSDYVASRLPFSLKRALRLETELTFVKRLERGSRVSYGGTYETKGDEWIGTLPIGYADGLKRGLRGQEVLIDGERMPIVGTICMDQCMVKLTKEYSVGEKVTLIGRQGDEEITMEEWARRTNTIPYEIAVSISKRVPRLYSV